MTYCLLPHPATPAVARSIRVTLSHQDAGRIVLCYRIERAEADLRVPPSAPSERADGLWRTTCAEWFVATAGETGYREFNFSPSGAWAIYDFSGPRKRLADPVIARPPAIEVLQDVAALTLTVRLETSLLPQAPGRFALTCVVEAADGALGYWAVAHPAEVPDFHHPGGFVPADPVNAAPRCP